MSQRPELTEYERVQILAFVRKFGTPDEIEDKLTRLEKLLDVDTELVQIGEVAKSKGVIRKHLGAFWALTIGLVGAILSLIANFEALIGAAGKWFK